MLYQQSTAYAIEALGYLATLTPSESIKARTLAQTLDIPEPFLAKVLSQLVRKRFVSSTKGPNGGFALAVDPGSVTLTESWQLLIVLLPLRTNVSWDCTLVLPQRLVLFTKAG